MDNIFFEEDLFDIEHNNIPCIIISKNNIDPKYWKTSSNKVVEITKMSDLHIINCYKMLQKKLKYLKIFEKEIKKRKLKVK